MSEGRICGVNKFSYL